MTELCPLEVARLAPPLDAPLPTLRPYQAAALAELTRLIAEGAKNILVIAPTGCHRAGQGILMLDGSVRRVEDVREGDRIMGPDSRARTVHSLCRGRQQMARIVPVKGEPWVVNLDHVLTLVRTNDGTLSAGDTVDVTVRDWLLWTANHKHVHKLTRVGVDFTTPTPDLPLDAYFLGLLLADGSFVYDSVSVCKPDPEVRAECEAQAAQHGLYLRLDDKDTTSVSYRFSGGSLKGRAHAPHPIMAALMALRLRGCRSGDKFIPDAYKTASATDRREILAGLLDGDGSHTHGGYDYLSQSERLARDVVFVARSLGLAAYVAPCQKRDQNGHGGTYWRVSVSGACEALPLRIPRKRATPRLQKKSVLRTGFAVELLDEEDYFGFTLDGNGRYLLDDFTVTHNSGKTVLFAHLLAAQEARGKRSVVLAHRKELLDQTYAKALAAGVRSLGMIRAQDKRANRHALVQIASVQTLIQRRRYPLSLVIVDEAQHVMAASYLAILQDYPNAVQIGFSATPWRVDKKPLGDLYTHTIVAATTQSLIDEGYLVRPVVYSHPVRADVSKVRLKGEEYDPRALAEAVDKRPLIGNLVEHWRLRAEGLSTIVFAASVAHSKHIVAAFVEAGVRAEHLDDTVSEKARAAILQRLSSGETQVLGNYGICTEGYDEPRVKCVVLARPTKSRGLYLQCVGRALRPYPGFTTATILDHAGSVLDFDHPQDPQDYAIDGEPKTTRDPNDAPVRICPECYGASPAGSLACVACGLEFPIVEREGPEHVGGMLVEVQAKAARLAEVAAAEAARVFTLRLDEAAAEARDEAAREVVCAELRRRITRLVQAFDASHAWAPGTTNHRLFEFYRKSRTGMNARELRDVLAALEGGAFAARYPLLPPRPAAPSAPEESMGPRPLSLFLPSILDLSSPPPPRVAPAVPDASSAPRAVVATPPPAARVRLELPSFLRRTTAAPTAPATPPPELRDDDLVEEGI